MSVSVNKTEFFSLISEQLLASVELGDEKQLFATVRDKCKCNQNVHLDALSPCNHEETRMFVHAFGAALSGHTKILIVVNDSDIDWITYSSKSKFAYIPIHEIVASMDKRVALALPDFRAFTGCDTTSSFRGKGKKTCFATWKSDPSYTTAFLEI